MFTGICLDILTIRHSHATLSLGGCGLKLLTAAVNTPGTQRNRAGPLLWGGNCYAHYALHHVASNACRGHRRSCGYELQQQHQVVVDFSSWRGDDHGSSGYDRSSRGFDYGSGGYDHGSRGYDHQGDRRGHADQGSRFRTWLTR